MIGFERADLLGAFVKEFVAEKDWPTREKYFLAALDGTPTLSIPLSPKGRRGVTSPTHIEASYLPIRTATGVCGVAVLVKDVTTLVLARESLRRHSLAFENIFDALVITDSNGIILDVNDAFTKITQIDRDHVVGKPISIMHPPDDNGRIMGMIGEALQDKGRWQGDVPFIRSDGSMGMCESSIVILAGDDGTPIGTIGAHRDTTAHHEAQQRITKQQAQLDLAMLNARLGSWEIDLRTREFIFASPSCLANYGLPPDATITLAEFAAMVHPDDRAGILTAVENSIATGATYFHQYRLYWPDGSLHWISAHAHPVFSEDGVAESMIGVSQDVTADKDSQAALVESNRRIVDILESMTEAFVAYDREWRFAYVNPTAEKRMRRTREELLGKVMWDVLPGLSGTEFERQYYRAMYDRVPVEFTAYHPAIGMWLDVRVFPTEEGIAVHARDVDDRVRSEVEKAESIVRQRTFLRDVLASVTEGKLMLCDVEDDLPPPMTNIEPTIELSANGGLRDLRVEINRVADTLEFEDMRWRDLQTSACEAGMNAIVHAGGGLATISSTGSTIQVRVEDHGTGIDVSQLPRATLEKGYTTAGSFGHGMKMMLQTTDRLFLLTGPTGTIVVIEQDIEAPPTVPLAWL
jgi:PAS domain S-box-containing protein